MSVNKFIGLGRVGKEPEIRTMPNGGEVASFSLGFSEKWKDKNSGERKEKTEWGKIVVFGNLASIVKNYVKKGSLLYIEGSVKTREYEKDGMKLFITEIVLQGFNSVLQILDGNKSPQEEKKSYDEEEGFFIDKVDGDEVPF